MPVSRPARHRIVLGAFAIVVAAITACDAVPTQPPPGAVAISGTDVAKRALEGDSTQCSRGYVIINGVIVCNPEQ